MAGLVPAIHVLPSAASKDVDARHKAHKAGHDDNGYVPCVSRILAWIFAMPDIQRS
jgi:hypothetical protein